MEEARRAVRDLGAVALILSNHPVDGRPWYDTHWDPLWAEAERLGVPITFHGIQMAYQEHLGRRFMDNFVLAHAAGHPLELMLALGSLLTGGVFARYPDLQRGVPGGQLQLGAVVAVGARRAGGEVRRRRALRA